MPELDSRAVFEIEKSRFQTAVTFAIKVSKLNAGYRTTTRVVLGSYLFTRMCVTATTVSKLLEHGDQNDIDFTLDHFSIAVLSRNIIEASIMLHYLLEDGITEEQWKLRHKVLDLHNTIVRLRLFKGLRVRDGNQSQKMHERFKEVADAIRAGLAILPEFKNLDKQRRDKIMSGSELYVGGIRSILKQFNVRVEYFDAVYNYLSAQVHVSSNTYYDMHRRINFGRPASYQFFVASFAIANARLFLLPGAFKVASTNMIIMEKIDRSELNSMENLSKVPFGDPA